MSDLLVIGKKGQLSTYFCLQTELTFKVLSSKELDLRQTGNIKTVLAQYNPKAVLNFSSYNDVEQAETSQDNVLINRDAIKEISEFCNNLRIPFVHVSTDYVFSGTEGNYNEASRASPINSYGRYKLEGEEYVRDICNHYLIIRTSWLYSSIKGRGSFLNKAMDMYFSKKREVYGAIDSIGSPTSAFSLGKALNELVPRIINDKNYSGTYHFSNQGRISRYEFLQKIFEILENKFNLSSPKLIKAKNSSFEMKAKRPKDTSLDCSKVSTTFGIDLENWENSLEEEINRIDGVDL